MVEYLDSASEKPVEKHAIIFNFPFVRCDSVAPIPVSDASVVSINGLSRIDCDL